MTASTLATQLQPAPALALEGVEESPEPFAELLERAASVLADLVAHEDCPTAISNGVGQIMADLWEGHSSLALDVRTRFAALAMAASAERTGA